jgi:hypothetical protein
MGMVAVECTVCNVAASLSEYILREGMEVYARTIGLYFDRPQHSAMKPVLRRNLFEHNLLISSACRCRQASGRPILLMIYCPLKPRSKRLAVRCKLDHESQLQPLRGEHDCAYV